MRSALRRRAPRAARQSRARGDSSSCRSGRRCSRQRPSAPGRRPWWRPGSMRSCQICFMGESEARRVRRRRRRGARRTPRPARSPARGASRARGGTATKPPGVWRLEHPRRLVAHVPEVVDDVRRGEDVRARGPVDDLVADVELDLALEDVERVAVPLVEVGLDAASRIERRTRAARARDGRP